MFCLIRGGASVGRCNTQGKFDPYLARVREPLK